MACRHVRTGMYDLCQPTQVRQARVAAVTSEGFPSTAALHMHAHSEAGARDTDGDRLAQKGSTGLCSTCMEDSSPPLPPKEATP